MASSLLFALVASVGAACPFSGNAVGACRRRASTRDAARAPVDDQLRDAAPVDDQRDGAELPPLQRGRQLAGFPTHIDPYAEPGLLNAGKGCWGICNKTAGPCDYCGVGSCCRQQDYDLGVVGCELANNITGARCGNWSHAGQDWLKNEGRACLGSCGEEALGGGCTFCGTGQCCRAFDADRCTPGCEAAGAIGPVPAPQSQCGNWWVHDDAATDPLSCVIMSAVVPNAL